MLALLGNVFILLIHGLLNNSYLLFQVSSGHNFKTIEILTHVYADFFFVTETYELIFYNYRDLGTHLL